MSISEDLWREILHWMHQRGDTIGATRVLACCRWERLHTTQFEKPLVCVLLANSNHGCNSQKMIVDAYGYPEVMFFRYRVYDFKNRIKLCGILHQLKTVGNVKNISSLLNKVTMPSNLDLRLDMRGVEFLGLFLRYHAWWKGATFWKADKDCEEYRHLNVKNYNHFLTGR